MRFTVVRFLMQRAGDLSIRTVGDVDPLHCFSDDLKEIRARLVDFPPCETPGDAILLRDFSSMGKLPDNF